MAELEWFIYSTTGDLPPPAKVALIHALFETIHLFLDGNGPIGRLLVAAFVRALEITV